MASYYHNKDLATKMKYYKGVTFPAGTKLEDGIVFENCTFQAQCTIGKGCTFVKCKFIRWSPPYYQNPWSTVGKGANLVDCSLDYVTIEKTAILKNPQIQQANVQGMINPMNQKTVIGANVHETSNCGIVVSKSGVKKLKSCEKSAVDADKETINKIRQDCCEKDEKGKQKGK